MSDCPFCKRIDAAEYDHDLSDGEWVAVFDPLNPVTPGHLLAVSWGHVPHAAFSPIVTGRVFARAAYIVKQRGYSANLITSIGPDATQTVFHLHVHIVPRRAGDGLKLPWTDQRG